MGVYTGTVPLDYLGNVYVDEDDNVQLEPEGDDQCPCFLQGVDCGGNIVPYWCQKFPDPFFDVTKVYKIDDTCLQFIREVLCTNGTEVTTPPAFEDTYVSCAACVNKWTQGVNCETGLPVNAWALNTTFDPAKYYPAGPYCVQFTGTESSTPGTVVFPGVGFDSCEECVESITWTKGIDCDTDDEVEVWALNGTFDLDKFYHVDDGCVSFTGPATNVHPATVVVPGTAYDTCQDCIDHFTWVKGVDCNTEEEVGVWAIVADIDPAKFYIIGDNEFCVSFTGPTTTDEPDEEHQVTPGTGYVDCPTCTAGLEACEDCPLYGDMPAYDSDLSIVVNGTADCNVAGSFTLFSNHNGTWGGGYFGEPTIISVGLTCIGGYWTLTISFGSCTVTMKKCNHGHGPTTDDDPAHNYYVTDGIGPLIPECDCTDLFVTVFL